MELASIDDLEAQWEHAARKADSLAARLQEFLKVGQPVPEDLVAAVAAAEEEVLMKLLAIEAARRSRPR
jgi:hypothetical protein